MKHSEYLRIQVLLILLPFKLQNVQSKSNFEIIYRQFNCTVIDPKGYIDKLSCQVRNNSKLSSISAELQFKKDLNKFNINLLIVLPRRLEDFVLVNLTRLNGCRVVANKSQVPLLQFILRSMNRFGNFVQGCPYKRDTPYYFRGFRLDLNSLPAIEFETDLKAWFTFLHKRDTLFTGYTESRIQLRRNG